MSPALRLLRFLSAVFVAGGAAAAALPAFAADTVSGTIKAYECGDNCYLTIATEAGEELVGLCAASACDPWNEEAAMPDAMVGKSVTVTVEMGQQVDGEGNVMGEFPSFVTVDVGN